jgi:hypothetical protein
MDAWLRAARDAVAATSEVPAADLELSDEDERIVLDLARIAAHDSGDRTNAPLLCYLIGVAAGTGAADLEAIAKVVRGTG